MKIFDSPKHKIITMNARFFTQSMAVFLIALLTRFVASAQGITAVTPSSGPSTSSVTITISYSGFNSPPILAGRRTNANSGYEYFTITNVTSTDVQAIVPAGSPLGTKEVFLFSFADGVVATMGQDYTVSSGSPPAPTLSAVSSLILDGVGTVTINGTGLDNPTLSVEVRRLSPPPISAFVTVPLNSQSSTSVMFNDIPSSIRHGGAGVAGVYEARVVTTSPSVSVSTSTIPAFISYANSLSLSCPTVTTMTTSTTAGGTISLQMNRLLGSSESITGITVGGLPVTSTILTPLNNITFDAPIGLGPGSYTIQVSFSGCSGTLVTSSGSVTITGSSPSISSVVQSPVPFLPPTTSGNITINGLNFTGATQVTLVGTPTIVIPSTSFTTNTATQIVIPLSAIPAFHGNRSVTVTTPFGTSSPSTTGVVRYLAPTISGVSPAVINASSGTLTITGLNFGNGVGVSVAFGTSSIPYVSIPSSSFTVVNNTTITVPFSAIPTFSGARNVRVTTNAGVATSTATVSRPNMTLTSFSPSFASRNTSPTLNNGTIITINGSNLQGLNTNYVVEFQTSTTGVWTQGVPGILSGGSPNPSLSVNAAGTIVYVRAPHNAVTGKIRLRSLIGGTTVTSANNINLIGTTFAGWSVEEENGGGETDNIQTIGGATSSVTLFPNPATDAVSVTTEGFTGEVTVALMDMGGALLETKSAASGADVQFNLANRQRGVYLVRLTDETGHTELRRLVKE